MASLSPPFILCPLPDLKTLLGIRPDRLQNKAIITLGKNIAIRYHVPEQKQESSWTTSRYWFTSPVTFFYDLGKYGAVLNHNIVALWEEGDSTLSNIEKVKLPDQVFTLHSKHDSRSVVVMKNGHAAYLSDLIEDKRQVKKLLLKPEDSIISSEIDDRNGRCYLVTKVNTEAASSRLSLVVVGIEKGAEIVSRFALGNDAYEIRGFCILSNEDAVFVVHFGSDGFMYKSKIDLSNDQLESVKLSSMKQFISDRSEMIMCPLLDNSSIGMYGSDASEEGAIALIYDIQYDLVVSKQPLKFFSVPPFMEKVGSFLFVPHGLHILVLTYRVTKSLLSSMVGKHQAKLDEEVFEGRNPWRAKGWEQEATSVVTAYDTLEASLKSESVSKTKELQDLKESYPTIWETIQQVKVFESEGQPESVICNHVIPSALEKGNSDALDWIINTFLDIPEVHIVSIVVFSLKDVVPSEENGNAERLNTLLLRKFDKHLLTQSLRYVDYDDIKKLLLFINGLIRNHWELDFDVDDEDSPIRSWLKWCSALVDAHYTKFVLHSDTKIIEDLLESVNECTNVMKVVEEMEPYLVMTYSKTSFEPTPDIAKRWRTETITFE